MTPQVGFSPYTPQQCDGMRTDPPMSVPTSKLVSPAATAAAEPPDEPPVMRSSAHGLFVVPNNSLCAWMSADHSGKFVLPNTIAPELLSRATAGASSVGTWSASAFDPPVERMPSVAIASLIVHGSPWSG